MTQNSAPHNLLRLSFDSCAEYTNYRRANVHMMDQIWRWHETLGDCDGPFNFHGICDICERQTTYTANPQKADDDGPFAYRVNWWSSALCACNMSNLDRAVLRVLLGGMRTEDKIYHVGYYSPFRQWLSDNVSDVTASQYEAGREAGEVENGIRYEDITCLSFADNEFDCIICMEVLEHLPDYRVALREMVRTLTPGGRAILSFPWMGGDTYDHLVRAETLPDGTIHHILPPEYHGDPAKSEAILSFRNFGWKILDEMRDAGFTRASAEFLFGPLHGYMTLLNPIIVGIC